MFLFVLPLYIKCQESLQFTGLSADQKTSSISGFIRGGFYYNFNNYDAEPLLSSGFSDFGLRVESSDYGKFKGFADIRYRYGSEFNREVSYLNIREAFVDFSVKGLTFTAGKKILKWGRADFTNTISKLNPVNMTARSPDREDMDMGNILASMNLYPSEFIGLEAVVVPYYRSSVLLTDPFPLPDNVSLIDNYRLVTDKEMISYALKADFHLLGVDFSLSWFDGYDPVPGTELSSFTLDMSGPVPVTSTELTLTPYKTRVLGFDFESLIGMVAVRGEAAWSDPYLSFSDHEYVPQPEFKWVAGFDFPAGNIRFTGEYSGKVIPDFMPAGAEPIFGTEPDLARLAEMLSVPGFDISEYVRRQVETYNRQYNYQLEKFYHSAGLRCEAELRYGKFLPSLFALYNVTTSDLILIPEIRIKPYDGVTLTLGADIYRGKKGSLFDLIDEFMTSAYAGLKVNF